MAIKNFLILIAFNFYFPLCNVDVGILSSTKQLDWNGMLLVGWWSVCRVGTWGASAHTHTHWNGIQLSRILVFPKQVARKFLHNWQSKIGKLFPIFVLASFSWLWQRARAIIHSHTRIHRHTRPIRTPAHEHSQRLLTYKQIHILVTVAAISKVLYALL